MKKSEYENLQEGQTLIVTQAGNDRGKLCTVICAHPNYRHVHVRLLDENDTFSGKNSNERLMGYESLGLPIEPYEVIFDRNSSAQWTHDQHYNELFLNAQLRYFTDLKRARGYVFLNELLGNCGLKWTKRGQVEGWTDKRINMEIIQKEDSFILVFITEGNILSVFNK